MQGLFRPRLIQVFNGYSQHLELSQEANQSIVLQTNMTCLASGKQSESYVVLVEVSKLSPKAAPHRVLLQ